LFPDGFFCGSDIAVVTELKDSFVVRYLAARNLELEWLRCPDPTYRRDLSHPILLNIL
jgi:hypothetical protein